MFWSGRDNGLRSVRPRLPERSVRVVIDYGAVTGLPTAEDALDECFEGEGNRFSGLWPGGTDLCEPSSSHVDTDGLTQLTVQLTDEFAGYLVAGYSYCTD
jgi:hypothetical protein